MYIHVDMCMYIATLENKQEGSLWIDPVPIRLKAPDISTCQDIRMK